MTTPDPKDPLLNDMIDRLEAALPAQHKDDYQRIVVAGMKVLFSQDTGHLLDQGIATHKANLGRGVIDGTKKLIATLYQESGQRMSVPMSVPAAITLMCFMLDHIESATGAKVDADMLGKMIQALTQEILGFFKIDQGQLAKGIDYARANKAQFEQNGSFQDPAAQPEQPVSPDQAPGLVGGAV